MTTSVIGLSIDCADPVALARFWSEVLGCPVNPGADAENAAIDVTDPAKGLRLWARTSRMAGTVAALSQSV